MRVLSFLLTLLLGASACAESSLREGDLIFHQSRSSQSLAVQLATGSRYSHMGMLLRKDGELQVFEASATVRYTPLQKWIARGDGGHYVVKRLRAGVDDAALVKLRHEAERFTGARYDLTFEWSDSRLYCSELVWKAYQRAMDVEIGTLQQVRDFNLLAPAVQAKMRERYGDEVPMDEPVISPVAMFESPLLFTVVEK